MLFSVYQGQMLIIAAGFVLIVQIVYAYKPNPTAYICIETSNERVQTLPSCLPGYVLDIENVTYESTRDNTCSGIIQCQIENKNAFVFACNRKRTCQIDLNTLRFSINSTCGTTARFFIQYRCLSVIQEQKDYLCESSTSRRPSLGDINLSCMRNYRLHITMAAVGISLKESDEISTKNRFKCNKETSTACITYVPNGYREFCDKQSKQECKITYNERLMLNDCPYGMMSNFSLVEYSCIPDESITEDLPRIDICSNDTSDRIAVDRGLLHSPNYPQGINEYLSCRKELFLPRQSRLRLYMLDKSLEFNIELADKIHALADRQLFDVNITNVKKDELVKFQLKTKQLGSGQFLLYFQVDSRISEYAPYDLNVDRQNPDGRGKFAFSRSWAIIIGCILGLLLLLLLLAIIFLISKRHRRRTRRYSKNDDDHRQRLNSPDHHQKHLPLEPPYLASSAATILPPPTNPNNRPHSASSTTSSIIMHQMADGLSDRETLIKPLGQIQSRPNGDIDNFYEEIKEQQQQTALALGLNGNKGDMINPYLEARCSQPKKSLFQGQSIVPPIRDHHEDEPRYQQPRSSNEQIEHSKKPSAPLE